MIIKDRNSSSKGKPKAAQDNILAGFAHAVASILLLGAIWQILKSAEGLKGAGPDSVEYPLIVLGVLLLTAVLAYIVIRGFQRISNQISLSWSYRLGVLLAGGLSILLVFVTSDQNSITVPTIIAAAGAILGGLTYTAVADGLWENNFPPSPETLREVRRRHQVQIGVVQPKQDAKRIFDLIGASLAIVVTAPLWAAIALLIWIADPGPILFIKNSVGRGGENFHQFKFRTMVRGAEAETGPVLAREEDERVLFVGKVLRRTALDELPQLWNILRGDMSFVGPRPQRTVLVEIYLKTMPEFAERHRIAPGLAGLAQVVGSYHITPRQKLRFDRLYARHASLGFDLKLLFLAVLLVFWFRWRKAWNGRLPRWLIRIGGPKGEKPNLE